MNLGFVMFLSFLFFLLGALAAGLYFYRRSSFQEKSLAELEAKREAAKNGVEELRKQMESKDQTLLDLRHTLEETQQARTIAQTRLEEAYKNIEEQKKLLDQAEEKLTTTFQAISGESLKSNNRAFLELAQETLAAVLKEAKGEIGQKEESIKGLVKPLEDALQRYERHIYELEEKRSITYGNLDSQIKSLVVAQQQLQKETGNLVTALRRPEVKGSWGQVTLKRVVELSGMSEHCDYNEQVSVNTDDGRLIPDLVVHLPFDRDIVIDSKVSTGAYFQAIEAQEEDNRKTHLLRHAQQVRKHMRDLASKNYWNQFAKAPEFVVMFLPGESFLSAAMTHDQALLEDGMEARVILAQPTTLIGLLMAIAYGWRQQQVEKSAQEIALLGKELYDRFQPFLEHVNKTGSALSQAVNHFNRMTSSLDQRVLVSVRKFKELGAACDKELPEIQPLEQIPLERND